jgi:hypothetical protein
VGSHSAGRAKLRLSRAFRVALLCDFNPHVLGGCRLALTRDQDGPFLSHFSSFDAVACRKRLGHLISGGSLRRRGDPAGPGSGGASPYQHQPFPRRFMLTERDLRPEPIVLVRASGAVDKTFTVGNRLRIPRSTHFPRSLFFFAPRCHEEQSNGKECETQQDTNQTPNDRISRVQQ